MDMVTTLNTTKEGKGTQESTQSHKQYTVKSKKLVRITDMYVSSDIDTIL